MEHSMSMITKKTWNIVRAVLFMLKRCISKSKIMLDLNMMIKRGKIAGKTMLGNIMFRHHHCHDEYEFSCSNSPAYFPFDLTKHPCNHHKLDLHDEQGSKSLNAVEAEPERLSSNAMVPMEASPMLSGFGRSPKVRQVRVTDSPFPLQDVKDEDNQVDRAAEEFIQKFYRHLKHQKNFMN